ncbi:DASH complex subunit Dad1-domain-containing protein [Schizophyllum fasciatum]
MSISRPDDDQSFFTKERERLSREIAISLESLLSTTNGLNRHLEEALGMTKEYDTVATLWGAFHDMMRGPDAGNVSATSEDAPVAGIPGTGGHHVTATTPAAKEKERDKEA